jgi:undecaprenyl-diphosphatase
LELYKSIIYGIVQGLTEWLPISSTAHLRVVPALLGWKDPGAAYTAVLQWGTLVAALIYFRADVVRILGAVVRGIWNNRPLESFDARMGWMIVMGTIPVAVLGLLFKKHIETTLRSLYVISAAAIGLALVLMLAEQMVVWRQRAGRPQKELGQLGWWDALVIGLFQAVALIPGASRSGVTITGGLFRNATRETAARFSFLLSLPAVFAAGVLELYKERHELLKTQDHVVNLIIATIIAGVVGYASIAWLIGYLKKHTTYIFIGYRVALGLLLMGLLLGDKIPAESEDEKEDSGGSTEVTSSIRPVGGAALELAAAARFDGADADRQPGAANDEAAEHVAEPVRSQVNPAEANGQHERAQHADREDPVSPAAQGQNQQVSEQAISDDRRHRVAAGETVRPLVNLGGGKGRAVAAEKVFEQLIQQFAAALGDRPHQGQQPPPLQQ